LLQTRDEPRCRWRVGRPERVPDEVPAGSIPGRHRAPDD
jgi:hypothetical protein